MRSEAEDAGCGPYVSAATCGVQPRETPLSGEQAAGPHCELGGSAVLPSRPRRQDFGKSVFLSPPLT